MTARLDIHLVPGTDPIMAPDRAAAHSLGLTGTGMAVHALAEGHVAT